jgi:hypothetical protein
VEVERINFLYIFLFWVLPICALYAAYIGVNVENTKDEVIAGLASAFGAYGAVRPTFAMGPPIKNRKPTRKSPGAFQIDTKKSAKINFKSMCSCAGLCC